MNPALTSYVLVNEANQPVPLPFHTQLSGGGAVTVVNFEPPHHANSFGRVVIDREGFRHAYFPSVVNLRLITENEFQAVQAGRPPFHLIDPSTGAEVSLPYYLPDDQQVTSVDREYLVVETMRSISWLDPAAYGLTIIADCDLP
jgi:hypothetical protein